MTLAVYAKPNGTQGSVQVNGVDSVVFDANGVVNGLNAPLLRQTVQSGVTSNLGYANPLVVGTGLALSLLATSTPMRTNFAAGLRDYVSTLSADTKNVVTLPANNLSYVTQDWVNNTSVTWSSTLAQPQYGYSYQQNNQSVLQFGGSSGSTTFLDDFGNTWIANGGAKVQTNQFKFGTGALGGAGTSNALNGSSDYISSTSFTTLGPAGWSLRAWVYSTVLPTSGNATPIVTATTSSGYGASLCLSNISGTLKFSYNLSSTGTSADIASNVQGVTTPTISTWYFVELTYDIVAGIYRLYVNGVQEASTTSASKVASGFNKVQIGGGTVQSTNYFFTGYIDKFEYLPYCQNPNGVGYAVPTQAPNIGTPGYASDFFSIPLMTMYQISGASVAAGVNPTFTAKNRVYVAEATTGTGSLTGLTSYAYNGTYSSVANPTTFAASTTYSNNHNLGVPIECYNTKLMVRTAVNYPWYENSQTYNGAWPYNSTSGISRNTSAVAVISSMITNQSTTSLSPSTANGTSGQFAFIVNRNF